MTDAQVRLDPEDYRRVIRRLNELQRDTEDLSPAMREVAAFLQERTLQSFDAESAPDSKPWAPLAPSTLRQKRKEGYADTILQRTRNLRDSIHARSDYRSATAGTNEEYAAIHQFGGEIDIPARAAAAGFGSISAHTITIPARPFLGFGPGDEDEIVDIIRRHLAE